jgi:hypothetical protein
MQKKEALMQYKIGLSNDKTYIVQKMLGEITCDAAMKCAEESHAMAKKFEIIRFLVDVTEARNVDTSFDNYQFANRDIDSPKIDKGAIVALLVSADDTSHDFVETVLRNAGHNVTLFRDRKQAERYLHASLWVERRSNF